MNLIQSPHSITTLQSSTLGKETMNKYRRRGDRVSEPTGADFFDPAFSDSRHPCPIIAT